MNWNIEEAYEIKKFSKFAKKMKKNCTLAFSFPTRNKWRDSLTLSFFFFSYTSPYVCSFLAHKVSRNKKKKNKKLVCFFVGWIFAHRHWQLKDIRIWIFSWFFIFKVCSNRIFGVLMLLLQKYLTLKLNHSKVVESNWNIQIHSQRSIQFIFVFFFLIDTLIFVSNTSCW